MRQAAALAGENPAAALELYRVTSIRARSRGDLLTCAEARLELARLLLQHRSSQAAEALEAALRAAQATGDPRRVGLCLVAQGVHQERDELIERGRALMRAAARRRRTA